MFCKLGNRTYCYAELAIFLVVAATIASTHFVYPRRDGQAEWAWVAWLSTWTVSCLSTNPAQCCVTLLMQPMMLLWCFIYKEQKIGRKMQQ